MTLKTSIKDGQGTSIEACVKPTMQNPKENALCINISGTSPGAAVSIIPAAGGGQIDSGLSENGLKVNFNAAVDGTTGSPIDFIFNAIDDFDFIVTDLIISGVDSSIKLSNWIGSNAPLVDGCILSLKANNELTTFDPFKRTLDLAVFATISGYDLLSEQAGDLTKTVRQFTPALIIRAKGTFGSSSGDDDFVKWRVQDSHSGIEEMRIDVRGFKVIPGLL